MSSLKEIALPTTQAFRYNYGPVLVAICIPSPNIVSDLHVVVLVYNCLSLIPMHNFLHVPCFIEGAYSCGDSFSRVVCGLFLASCEPSGYSPAFFQAYEHNGNME